MDILPISADSPQFEAVVALGKRNSRWLGHFPRGAFAEAATRGRIVGAVAEDGTLLGYILYRISRTRAVIVHLCVAEPARGQGIARKLFEALKSRTSDCSGVLLRCRRDFAANAVWRRLGFNPVNERPGRSLSGKMLTIWLYEYDQPTLFTEMEDPVGARGALAVLDANVLYDLQDPLSPATEESHALHADWLSGELEFRVTEEIYHEIYRAASAVERDRRRQFASRFHPIIPDPQEQEQISSALRPLFPAEMSDNDRSDLRHLAITAAAGAPFFITRDDDLLDKAEEVYEHFGISILRPCELVIGFDQRIRGSEYMPARMGGSLTEGRRVTPSEIPQLAQTFQDFTHRERKSEFQRRLRASLLNPHASDTYVVRDLLKHPVALYTADRSSPGRVVVPLLRVRRGRLAQGLTHHILWKVTREAAEQNRSWVVITEPHLPADAEDGLRRVGFLPAGGKWVKLVVGFVGTRTALHERARAQVASAPEYEGEFGPALATLADPHLMAHPRICAEIERLMWPSKIEGGPLPSFIVPIRPDWASHLFDERLASQDLFGAEPELALSVQNVYYRSAHSRVITAPARILWYVSAEKGWSGSKSIRAVSYVTEVLVDSAKELYRRFKRLGIYRWSDVLVAANGRPHHSIMAFVFTHTELLPNPISWNSAQATLRSIEGRGNQFQGPVRITDRCFMELYRLGTTLSAGTHP